MSTTHATVSTDQLRAMIREELDSLTDLRHDLHAHPELAYQEQRTSEVVRRELEKAGVTFVGDLAGGTGVLGHLPGQSDQTIGLRTDMDALPIVEQTGLPYASTTEGVMHACGHDGHTTNLIGTARVLAQISRSGGLPHGVTFVFQPAEEGGAGGKRMVEDGCLDGSLLGTPVTQMYGLHGWPQLELGKVATRPGPMLAAADMFEVTVRGVGAHAAYPHDGRDPIYAASMIVAAVQQLASRNVNPLDSIVVSVTKFHGGTAHNIIPMEVQIGGTVPTLTPETRTLAQARLREVIEHTARACGCEADLDYQLGYPVTRNDEAMVERFNRIAGEAIGADHVPLMQDPVMGGEDFAYYGQKVPACFFALGLVDPGAGAMPLLHHPTFNFNDKALPLGIEMFCALAMG